MVEVDKGIFIGTVNEISVSMPAVNLTHTYHYHLHGWKVGENHKSDNEYILAARPNLLSVNWVDGAARYYDYLGWGNAVCSTILDFIDQQNAPTLICCNKGISRSPSIALLCMAKRKHTLPADSFESAREVFEEIYPPYQPGGIADFLSQHWNNIQ